MKRIALTLIVALLALPAVAMAKADLVVVTDAPPKSMNPHAFSSDANLSYMSNFFDGLLQRPAPDGKLSPALAVRWERLDGTTWKFDLRKGVKFHNGNDFTAADVKFTFERMKDPQYSKLLNIANSIASIETPDDHTVIFKTVKPVPWFAETMHQNFIVDMESSKDRDDGDYNTRPIGTGAYKFVEWVKGSYVRMTANEDYWEGAPKYKNVDIRPITEEATRFAALAGKQADIVNGVPVTLIERIEKMPHVQLISRPARRAIYMDISNKEGTPFADIRVRKAIAHAINEDEIIEKVMRGQATPAAQVPDVPTVGYVPGLKRLSYDPALAKKLLADAGYPDGFAITVAGPNDRYVNDEKICEAVAKYLAKIGLKVTLDVKPKSIFFDELSDYKHRFYLIGWFDGSYDFGRSAEKLLHTPDKEKGMGAYNGAIYSDPELDKMIIDSSSIIDRAERQKALQAINKKSVEDVAWIPLHYQQDIYAVVKDSGVAFTPRPDQWIVAKEIK
ncbi:ABC transporter substrate-binding protein [Desulfosarcina widdelii]|uniref:ABC transporter substrate-binding protein n=1 Tax=Desulfosarcina widdelii TaxID=947919 RepID=A0A5K7ZH26_9BACT|nr:ABC transporter substrate-binding protein [Desulfosarcina widdelii]BBO75397.1 ABC transporter substrate-binding protein [Desulfosarcina widdelii]